MKNLFLLIITLGICLPSSGQDVKEDTGYTIDGCITGLKDKSLIYLIHGSARKRIDSAIVSSSCFKLEGHIVEPAHTYLYQGKTTKLADILLDNRQIKVSGTAPVYDSVSVHGSDIDAQWKEWFRHDQRIGYQRYRLNNVYESLMKRGDTVNSQIVKELRDELVTDRVSLLKNYVKRYGNSPSGAVLPSLCTIQASLTREDFVEMYNSLSEAMRATTMGKEILKMAQAR